jgi:hypothetical protein
MNAGTWPLVELSSRLLEARDREIVLGDLAETEESAWRCLLEVFGLALRRQAGLWRKPWPWLAGLLVALPGGFLLMVASFSVSCTWERLVDHRVFDHGWPTGHEGFVMLACHILLVGAWSWSAAFIVGSISRRTLWASSVLAIVPFCMLTCVPFFRPCFFLFLPPAIMGALHGWRGLRVSLRVGLVLAVSATVLMIAAWCQQALWMPNWVFLLPSWYFVLVAWRSGSNGRGGLRQFVGWASPVS